MEQIGLLVIDMQRAYFQDPVLKRQQERLVSSCNELMHAAKTHHVPIWNIVTEHTRDKTTWTLNMKHDDQGFLFHGSEAAAVVDGLGVEDARTIIKTRDSAFFDTSLADELAKNGVEKLIICGVSTQSCVMQTAADAYAHNYTVIIAGDAIAANNPEFHDVTVKLLQTEYRQTIATHEEVLALMAGTES